MHGFVVTYLNTEVSISSYEELEELGKRVLMELISIKSYLRSK